MLALKSGAWRAADAAVSRYPKLGAPRSRAAVPAHCAVLGLHARSGRTRPARCNPQNCLRPVTPGGGLVPTLTRSESQGVAARGGPARASPGGGPWNSNCAPRETATAPLFHGLYKRAHHCLRPQRFPVLRLASASSYHQDDGSLPRSLFNAAGCHSARVGCYAQALKTKGRADARPSFVAGWRKAFLRPFSFDLLVTVKNTADGARGRSVRPKRLSI